MSGNQSSPENGSPGSPSKLSQLAAGTLSSALEYLHVRFALLGLEAREARRSLIAGTLLFFVGAFFLLLCWMGCCVALIAKTTAATEFEWPDITLAVAGIHALAGIVLFLVGRKLFSTKHFRDSLAELENDREWLNRFSKRPPQD